LRRGRCEDEIVARGKSESHSDFSPVVKSANMAAPAVPIQTSDGFGRLGEVGWGPIHLKFRSRMKRVLCIIDFKVSVLMLKTFRLYMYRYVPFL